MPAMIRTSGQMWNADNKLQDTIALIPDRCYSGVYEATIDFCKRGAFDNNNGMFQTAGFDKRKQGIRIT
jgi:monomeric isocitrate dehydrogenase